MVLVGDTPVAAAVGTSIEYNKEEMKIEHKIMLSNAINILLIILVSWFAVVNLDLMLARLRFAEILDEMNLSLFEMRLSEKNYFLFGNPDALSVLEAGIARLKDRIATEKNDIVKATGEQTLRDLERYLDDYERTAARIGAKAAKDIQSEEALRARGRKLKEFAEETVRMERSRVDEMASRSRSILIVSLLSVVAVALIVSRAISKTVLAPVKQIEKLARSISDGHFSKIEAVVPKDEFGPVIEAINSMSEELKNREEAIIQSRKLASMGILCAGVAHELNNPLNNISMISQTYQGLNPKLTPEERIGFMREIDAETDRMKEIVKNLLNFSRPKEVDLSVTGVNSIVEKTMKLLQNTLDISGIETTLELQPDLPPVRVDPNRIQQVLVNLVMNAIQALSPGGRLSVSTGPATGAMVQISVKDTGRGIPPEFLPHIFDPFFTTREEGGTGLGLWVSYGIVRNHGGDIRVESEVGRGSTFTVELPIFR
jgi:two-component system NtrC family sensor kinase